MQVLCQEKAQRKRAIQLVATINAIHAGAPPTRALQSRTIGVPERTSNRRATPFAPVHSALKPDAWMIGLHFAVSARMIAVSSSGLVPVISNPRWVSF